MTEGERPLDAALGRIDALDPWCTYTVGAPGDGGWYGVAEIVEDGSLVAGWLAHMRANVTQGRGDVAGSYLASWLGSLLVGPAAVLLATRRRTWRLTSDLLAVHLHAGGWFDGLAVRSHPLQVVAGDPLAAGVTGCPPDVQVLADIDVDALRAQNVDGSPLDVQALADVGVDALRAQNVDGCPPDVQVLADVEVLRAQFADDVVGLLTPVFGHIRAHASFGLSGMWGTIADAVADQVVQAAERDGMDVAAAWCQVAALTAALAERVPLLRARPSLAPVTWSGGVTHMTVRGTCCLFHKISGCELDPVGDAYCVNCPSRDPADRRRRWAAELEELAAT